MAKIQKQTMPELVSQEIQNYIEEKELREGDKLPSVEAMTNMFGVGRSSLREALRYLEAIDAITVVNGKGIYVRDVGTYRFAGKIKIEKEKQFLLSILEVRRALEGKAVELAAKRITQAQIEELTECLNEYAKLKEAGEHTAQIDLAFHRGIMKAAGNTILYGVLESFSVLYEKFFNEPLGDTRLFDETYEYHHTMFAGIAARDPELALSEFDKLMNCIEDIIRTY
ncbi:FadR/GntR family transcriptional regulator [Cohnella lupini]|uniref:GntR family transcriptional repressor for pyruvate dehydrogenase complex n=1 Tax=Cohnella lupini TaxID=1294267 RepID=A0A3D9I0L7_9BACL|nr:FadR/GntR family transcriptional regulator [Cohnella lupini]RED55273.1 GntR family transcriptional repressor for pyruvate dehydrogenase complex [Cohnella lupini]